MSPFFFFSEACVVSGLFFFVSMFDCAQWRVVVVVACVLEAVLFFFSFIYKLLS